MSEQNEILKQIPQELWNHILSYINEWSLLKLMTVSKQFKQILEQSFTIFNCSWRRVSPNFVPRLAQFKNLQTLHFTTTKSTLHHIFSLKKLNYLTIEQLDRELLSPESFAGIGELKFLTRMWADAQFMDTTLPFLMEQLTSLRRLILYCPFSQALFDSLAKNTNLQYLCLIDSETNTEISRTFRIPLYSSLTCFELLNTMHIFDASDVIKITSLRSLALHYTDNILNYELLTRLTSLNELLVHTERDVMHKIQILTSLFNLTKLDFYTPRLDDSKLMYLTRISSLRSLALERMFADPLHIQTHIQHLTLLGLATPKTEDFSLFFLQHTQLIDLYLQSKPYWAINLQRVTLLRNLNRLTVGPIVASDFPNILKLTKLTKLRLTLADSDNENLVPQLEHISLLSNLTSLFCVRFHITSSILDSITRIRSLRGLSFVKCTFDNFDNLLILSRLYDLTHLRLKGDTVDLFILAKKLRKITEYGIIYEGPIPSTDSTPQSQQTVVNNHNPLGFRYYTQIYV